MLNKKLVPLLMALILASVSCNKANLNIESGSSFTSNWGFDVGFSSNYDCVGPVLEYTGGVCRLVGTDQVDDNDDCSGFGDGVTPSCGGDFTAVTFDTTYNYLRLSQTGTPTNTAELDESWTPAYSNIVNYFPMNGTAGALIANNDTVTVTFPQ